MVPLYTWTHTNHKYMNHFLFTPFSHPVYPIYHQVHASFKIYPKSTSLHLYYYFLNPSHHLLQLPSNWPTFQNSCSPTIYSPYRSQRDANKHKRNCVSPQLKSLQWISIVLRINIKPLSHGSCGRNVKLLIQYVSTFYNKIRKFLGIVRGWVENKTSPDSITARGSHRIQF